MTWCLARAQSMSLPATRNATASLCIPLGHISSMPMELNLSLSDKSQPPPIPNPQLQIPNPQPRSLNRERLLPQTLIPKSQTPNPKLAGHGGRTCRLCNVLRLRSKLS